MKTAIEQLKEDFKSPLLYLEMMKVAIDWDKYLEIEKEQIINAYCDGAKGGANGTKGQHEFGWVSRHTRNKYYNEKYNQNK